MINDAVSLAESMLVPYSWSRGLGLVPEIAGQKGELKFMHLLAHPMRCSGVQACTKLGLAAKSKLWSTVSA